MLSFFKRLISKDKTANQNTPLLPPAPKQSTRELEKSSYSSFAPQGSGYSEDLQRYLEECEMSPLSVKALAAIQSGEFMCRLSFLTPRIPVRINGELYDLKALENLDDFQDVAGFYDPSNKTAKRYFPKDIKPARDVREKIVKALQNTTTLKEPGEKSPSSKAYQALQPTDHAQNFEDSNLKTFKPRF
jgi:hypothetical protein